MIDSFGREIDYLRISITDRCDMRCLYCMPDGLKSHASHGDIIRYEEIVRLCRLFATLGIRHVRLTGGEPMMRRDVTDLIAALKAVDGIKTVTMTSNGHCVSKFAQELKKAGLDGMNISLDSLDPEMAAEVNGLPRATARALEAIRAMQSVDIPVKVNTVLLEKTRDRLLDVTSLAEQGIPVRFIELMPVGCGNCMQGIPSEEALQMLREKYGDLVELHDKFGCGPARYFSSSALKAPVGLIDAVSHRFCGDCNRIRLTSLGKLKPCLCFDTEWDLLTPLRQGMDDEGLLSLLRESILSKPRQHEFGNAAMITEHRMMSEIGG